MSQHHGQAPRAPASSGASDEQLRRRARALSELENDGLIDALRRLPDREAEVIALAFFGELSHSEIAKQLALPKDTVEGRMRLGRQKLRRQTNDPGTNGRRH